MTSRRLKVWPQFFSFYAVDFTLQTMCLGGLPCSIDWLWLHWGFLVYYSFSPINVDSSDKLSIDRVLQVCYMRYKLWRLRSLHLEWNGWGSSLTIPVKFICLRIVLFFKLKVQPLETTTCFPVPWWDFTSRIQCNVVLIMWLHWRFRTAT